jgi:hypothetical protein
LIELHMRSETELRQQLAELEQRLAFLQQRRDELLGRLERWCGGAPPMSAETTAEAGPADRMTVVEQGDDEDHDIVEVAYVLAGARAHVATLEFLLRDIATNCRDGGGATYRIIVDAQSSDAIVLWRDGVAAGLSVDELARLAEPTRFGPSVTGIDVDIV